MQIEDEGPAVAKRACLTRISVACNPCRKRKTKCGGEQPVCEVCKSVNRTCAYVSTPRKRGLERGYVRSLEVLLSVALRHFPQLQDQVEEVLRSEYGQNDLLEPQFADLLSTSWRSSRLAQKLDGLLTAADEGGLATVDWLLSEPHSLIVTLLNTEAGRDVRGGESGADASASALRRRAGISDQSLHLAQLKLPEQTTDLVEFYFDYTHCWFPIVERTDILKSVYGTRAEALDSDPVDIGHRLCLWAIIAYSSKNRRFDSTDYDADLVERLVRVELMKDDAVLELGAIQALMILALLYVARSRLQIAWMFVGHTSRLLQTYCVRTAHKSRRYQQALLGCNILEQLLSIQITDRPFHPSRDMRDRSTSAEYDSLDEWQPWTPSKQSLALTTSPFSKQPLRCLSCFKLLYDMLEEVERLTSGTTETASASQVSNALIAWRSSLPDFAQHTDSTSFSPPLWHLHLVWHVMLSSLLTATSVPGQDALEIILQECRSALHLLRSYIDAVGLGNSSPLLLLCAMQAQKALSFSSQGSTDQVTLIGEIQEIVAKLASSWESTSKNGATHAISDLDQETSHSELFSARARAKHSQAFNNQGNMFDNDDTYLDDLSVLPPGTLTTASGNVLQAQRIEPAVRDVSVDGPQHDDISPGFRPSLEFNR